MLRAASSTVVRNGWSKHFPGFRRAPSNPSPQVSESQVGRKLLELPLPIMPYVGKEERNETCQLEYMCHRSWTPGHVYGVHNGKGAQVIISLDSLKRTIESYDLNWRDERGWGRLTGNVLDRGACLEDRHHISEIYQSWITGVSVVSRCCTISEESWLISGFLPLRSTKDFYIPLMWISPVERLSLSHDIASIVHTITVTV